MLWPRGLIWLNSVDTAGSLSWQAVLTGGQFRGMCRSALFMLYLAGICDFYTTLLYNPHDTNYFAKIFIPAMAVQNMLGCGIYLFGALFTYPDWHYETNQYTMQDKGVKCFYCNDLNEIKIYSILICDFKWFVLILLKWQWRYSIAYWCSQTGPKSSVTDHCWYVSWHSWQHH